jgi:hypothetical protein
MARRKYKYATWQEVPVPFILRYRKRPFTVPLTIAGALLTAGLVCVLTFDDWTLGAVPTVVGLSMLLHMIRPIIVVRRTDRIRVDERILTVYRKDGKTERFRIAPDVEYTVQYISLQRSIAVSAEKYQHRRRTHIIFDLLHLPPELSIYGLCQKLNDLAGGLSVSRSGIRLRSDTPAIRRRSDWYANPPRVSRISFVFGFLALVGLMLAIEFGLHALSDWLGLQGQRIGTVVAGFAISLLAIHPAFRFLAVARLRDLGEDATNRNAYGLVWNRAAGGSLRLFLRKGQSGRNRFGVEPSL